MRNYTASLITCHLSQHFDFFGISSQHVLDSHRIARMLTHGPARARDGPVNGGERLLEARPCIRIQPRAAAIDIARQDGDSGQVFLLRLAHKFIRRQPAIRAFRLSSAGEFCIDARRSSISLARIPRQALPSTVINSLTLINFVLRNLSAALSGIRWPGRFLFFKTGGPLCFS